MYSEVFYIAECIFFFLPPPVHKLHGLHCQCCGNYVISIVSPPTDHHQPIHLPDNKHKAVLGGKKKHTLLDG